MFHNLITRPAREGERVCESPSRYSRTQFYRESDRAVIEGKGKKSDLRSRSLSSLFLSREQQDETRSYFPPVATRDVRLFARRFAGRKRETSSWDSRGAESRGLIDSAVYPDCRIIEDVVSRKYPPEI